MLTVNIGSMSYTKLDCGITDSTIWQAPDATRLVWITMLAMVDQNGYVGASMPGLAGRARVSLDACIAAVKTLESPDLWSRSKEHEGRRIAEADGGWILLNHAKYRAKQSADDRRERSRIAMAELRAKRREKANGYPSLTKLPLHESKLSQAEADTDTDTEEKKKKAPAVLAPPPLAAPPTPPPNFDGKNADKLNGRAVVLLDSGFELPDTWGFDAEALGWQPKSVINEAERFRQYWTTGKGTGKRRSIKGWRQSWSNWLHKAEGMAR